MVSYADQLALNEITEAKQLVTKEYVDTTIANNGWWWCLEQRREAIQLR